MTEDEINALAKGEEDTMQFKMEYK